MSEHELNQELCFLILQGNNFLAQHFPNIWKQQRRAALAPKKPSPTNFDELRLYYASNGAQACKHDNN